MESTLTGFDGEGWTHKNSTKSNGAKRQKNRSHARTKITARELIRRIDLGKFLLSVKDNHEGADWAKFLQTLGIDIDFAQICIRVARRFGSLPRMDQVTNLEIPFNIIETLSSELVEDAVIDEFLEQMQGVLPTTRNCQALLEQIRPSITKAMPESINELECIEPPTDNPQRDVSKRFLREVIQVMTSYYVRQEQMHKEIIEVLTSLEIA